MDKAALTSDPDDEEAPEHGEELCEEDHDRDDFEDDEEVTWGEVGRSCCCHTPKGWFMIFLVVCLVTGILYFFILSLDLLSTSAQVLTGCAAAQLFENTNPIAALMVGILATVLLQSSSTTTSIIVSLVGAGLDVQAAIYMVMGSNIGTSVTNTLVAMGQMGNGDELERAFAGATVHDMFNFLSCLILLPFEVITGYLYRITKAMVKNVDMPEQGGSTWRSPIRTMTDGIVNAMIISNRRLVAQVADGGSCDDFYPVFCEGGIESFQTCTTVGLIRCNSATNKCPAFFQNGATAADDKLSGGVCLFISLLILFVSLLCLVAVLHKVLVGSSERIIYKATNVNGYLALVIGAGLTMIVQSSTVTTATLTPLVGLDVIRIEQMYPLTLGANIGTTLTGFLAAMVSANVNSLQVALAHLFFNITGILIWYPIPFMRRIPIHLAKQLGMATRVWRFFPVVYIVVAFFVLPLMLLAISTCFTQDSVGMTALGSILVIFVILGCIYFIYWWRWKEGRTKCYNYFVGRQKRSDMMKALPDTINQIHQIQTDVDRMKEVIDIPEDDEKENEEDQKLLPEHTEDLTEIEENNEGRGKKSTMDDLEFEESIKC